jgi:hypothetical protein
MDSAKITKRRDSHQKTLPDGTIELTQELEYIFELNKDIIDHKTIEALMNFFSFTEDEDENFVNEVWNIAKNQNQPQEENGLSESDTTKD